MDAEFQIIHKILQAATGVASVLIAWSVLRIGLQQRRDSWLRTFNELHQSFWSDDDFDKARAMIANDEEYLKLDAVLRKRLIGRAGISVDEYERIEKIDKFLNFFIRAHEVAGTLRQQDSLYARFSRWLRERSPGWLVRRYDHFAERRRGLWKRLYFQYWLDDIVVAGRHSLFLYIRNCYDPYSVRLLVNRGRAGYEQFESEAVILEQSLASSSQEDIAS